MEVVVIDKATFERMLSGFEIFAEKVERLCREQEDLGEKEWLDSDDVCRLLCISPRTLQTMRENGCKAFKETRVPAPRAGCLTDKSKRIWQQKT